VIIPSAAENHPRVLKTSQEIVDEPGILGKGIGQAFQYFHFEGAVVGYDAALDNFNHYK
jgi:hypothetical protein